MATAMKISPSVMAASETWLAMAQLTSEEVNQWAAPQENAARAAMMTVQKIAYGHPARLTGFPVLGLRYTRVSPTATSPPSTPATIPASSTRRALPWVAGLSMKMGMITAAATTGRSIRIGPILRSWPRSLARTVARTTPLTIIASVSGEIISRAPLGGPCCA